MEWLPFSIAFVAFIASHSAPVRPPVRPMVERVLGKRGFSIAYSLLSVSMLVWLIVAANRAPFVLVWGWAAWQPYAALILTLGCCLVIALAMGRPNPLSFGGGKGAFDPTRPGLIRMTRHPILTGLALWALAHLIANGDLAHVIVFGFFALFATFGGRLIDLRKRRELGDQWTELRGQIAAQPFLASGWSEYRPSLRISAGLTVWVCLLAAHLLVLGVSPLP